MVNIVNDRMIALGDKRVPISTIKEYGITTEDVYYKKVFKRKVERGTFRDNCFYEWHGEKIEVTITYALLSKKQVLWRDEDGKEYLTFITKRQHVNEPHYIVEKEKCMYVKTYQGEVWHYRKTKVPFDIEEKCKELDELFNGK